MTAIENYRLKSTLFIGCIPAEADFEQLYDYLKDLNLDVVTGFIVRERGTGYSKGCACVEFITPEEAVRAMIEIPKHNFGYRAPRVDRAKWVVSQGESNAEIIAWRSQDVAVRLGLTA